MAVPILWAPGIFGFFLLENPHAHKISRFGGGGLERGGSANFIFMGVGHRCPTYQLHLPPKCDLGTPKPSPGKCWKIPVNSGFPLKEYSNVKKTADPRIPENSLWDDFPWRMRTAKVDMLGTAEAWGIFPTFSLEKQEDKIPPKDPQQNSNQSSGASRPRSTPQGSAFQPLRRAREQKKRNRKPSRGQKKHKLPKDATLLLTIGSFLLTVEFFTYNWQF